MKFFLKFFIAANMIAAAVLAYTSWQVKETNRGLAGTVQQLEIDRSGLQGELARTQIALSDKTDEQSATFQRLQDEQRTTAQLRIERSNLKDNVADLENAVASLRSDLAEADQRERNLRSEKQVLVAELNTQLENNSELRAVIARQEADYGALAADYVQLYNMAVSTQVPDPQSPLFEAAIVSVDPIYKSMVVDLGDDNSLPEFSVGSVHRNNQLIGKIRVLDTRIGNLRSAELLDEWSSAVILPGDQILF